MGLSKKHQLEPGRESSESKRWVIAGVATRAPLKPISTKLPETETDCDGACSTTPTSRESKIPEPATCPPAPRKRRPSSNCHPAGVREFFSPPDLESVFMCRAS